MAKEPNNVVLRLLREIRATQDVHSSDLTQLKSDVSHLKGKVDDLYKISTHTLGVAVNAHARYEELEDKVDKLSKRIARLEAGH